MDHFARFGLPRSLAVDRKALERAHERLSFRYHPDLLTAASPEERQQAQVAAAGLNEAYRILADGTERAAYLLGLLIAEAQAAGRLPPGTELNAEALPPGFLQEMFALQEEVDEADAADEAGRGAALAALQAPVAVRRAATLAERERLFERAAAGGDAGLFQAIQSNLNQEKYLLRLLERLHPTSALAAS